MPKVKKAIDQKGDYFNTDHLQDNLRKKAVKGAGATIFAQIINYGIQTIGIIFLARILTPIDFGLVTMVVSFSLLLQNFGVNGFTEAIIQKKEIDHKQMSTLFWTNFGISFGLTLLFICFSPIIAWFYDEPQLEVISIAMAFSIIFGGLSALHLALLKRGMQFFKTSANDVGAGLFSTALAIFLALQGWGYWALVSRRLAIPFSTTIGVWWLCKWRPGLPVRGTKIGSMLKFAFNTYGSFCLTYFRRNLDKILIGRFYSSESLGHYDRAYHLSSMLPNQLSVPLTSVAIATLSRLQSTPEKYYQYFVKILSLLAFISFPLSALLTILGKDIIILLLGQDWEQAGEIFSAFGPGIGMIVLYGTHVWLHISLGKANRLFRWGLISFFATIAAFLIGLLFGPIGVAIAYSSSFYFLFFPALWYAGRPMKIKWFAYLTVIWKYWIAAFIAGILCWYFYTSFNLTSSIIDELNIFVRLGLFIFFYILIYVLIVILLYQSIQPISLFLSLSCELIGKSDKK